MTCAERYRRTYVEREKPEVYSASKYIGDALHEAFEYAARHRKRYVANATAEEVAEKARSVFQALVAQDAKLPDPIPWEVGDVEARTEDVRRMAELWASRQDKFWSTYGEPVAIEHGFTGVSVGGSEHTIGGTIDLVTNLPDADLLGSKFIPIDWKSGSSAWRNDKERKQVQRLFYSRAIEDLTGVYPETFYFIQVVRSYSVRDGQWSYSLRTYPVKQRPKEEKELLAVYLNEWSRLVEAGIFPLNTSSGLCSAEWCPFYSTCPGGALGEEADAA